MLRGSSQSIPTIHAAGETRFMRLALIALVLLICFPVQSSANGPEEYRNEVYARGLVAQSRMTVLSLALQPGFEDLAALSYLRFGRGAKIVNAFVTNGESGDNDLMVQGPGEIAFQRRGEAFKASAALHGVEYFLNFPDFGSARDTAFVNGYWPPDTLEAKLRELIESTRPDLILLAPDRQEEGGEAPRWVALRSALGKAVRAAAQKKTASGFVRPRYWEVGRVLTASSRGSLLFPLDRKPEFDSRTYRTIGVGIGTSYESMKRSILRWQQGALSYSIDFPSTANSPKTPDAGIPGRLAKSLQGLGREMDGLWNQVLTAARKGAVARTKPATLKRLVRIMDSIDVRLSGWNFFANHDRKTLLHWKEGLEELRNAVVGVFVRYTIRDTVLLARQLTTIRVDSVIGLPSDGITEIFFPDVGPTRWFLNEGTEPKVPLAVGSEYRLISPGQIDLDLPASYGGRMKNRHGYSLEFFILHQKKSRVESFFKKVSQRMLFAPKLTVEPLTPIVRIAPRERLVCKITNHSNDGLLERLMVRDSLGTADGGEFRLNKKEASVVDTLSLNWNEAIPVGTYRVPLYIGESVVGYFGARKFDVSVDSVRPIGILSSGKTSVAVQTFRRLGVNHRILNPDGRFPGDPGGLRTIVIDERVLGLGAVDSLHSFKEFVERGGTLLILSQDADVWNREPLIEGVSLSATASLDAQTDVLADTLHRIWLEPNRLEETDWEEWLFSRAPNKITIGSGHNVMTPLMLSGGTQIPGIVVVPRGEGKWIYVNLNLGKQLENIHPGAFRFLANLLAY